MSAMMDMALKKAVVPCLEPVSTLENGLMKIWNAVVSVSFYV
jgi:hypothetical protein